MIDFERIASAKEYIDKLANGINPLDDTHIPEEDIVNNVHVSRCLFYVSDLLRQLQDNSATKKPARSSKVPFVLTYSQINSFEYSTRPISISEVARRLYACANDTTMEKITPQQINQGLMNLGMLYSTEDSQGKTVKRPTEDGSALGISVETRSGQKGFYRVVVYNKDAQQFIVDNYEAILVSISK